MEKQKSKMTEILRKISSSTYKGLKLTHLEASNLNSFVSPKHSRTSTPRKSSGKPNLILQKSSTNFTKYAINKSSLGTPHEKSALLSYISTPNEYSITKSKLKKVKSKCFFEEPSKKVCQSTEDENLSEKILKVEFILDEKKMGCKKFMSFETVEEIRSAMMDLLRKENTLKDKNYHIIGLEPVPYCHKIRMALNQSNTSIHTILNNKKNQISVKPLFVKSTPNFDTLELSDFQILKYLGSGGFSTVYLARCKVDQKVCALKFIKKASITSARKVKMLENEKEILFSIDSPYLVDLLYAFETHEHIVFGIEYCENGNLFDFLQENKKIEESDAKYIFKQILEGLDYLHENSILFRDLKLENILFDENGKIKITDFGLSKPSVSDEDITYSYCGSPEYMAPEMLAKCGHSFMIDFYALGILLYELIFGVSPFYAAKKEDIFVSIMNSEPKFPKETPISKELKELIKGLLTKDPDHRIGSLKGVKEIKTHPWLRNDNFLRSDIFNFPCKILNTTTKEMKEVKDNFKEDLSKSQTKKYFFPKSFVNKRVIAETLNSIQILESKTKAEKQNKSKSKLKKKTKTLN